MKHFFIFSLMLTFLAGCDAPQRTKFVEDTLSASSSNSFTEPGSNFGGSSTVPGSPGGTPTSTMPAGFATCDITPKYYAPGIGNLGLCQSALDETSVLVKPTLTDTSARTCLIPTYKDSTGSSAYIGQPQCLYTQENKLVNGMLYKNRSGYTQSVLNGVMVMKEGSMPAYFQCMDAYVNYVSQACPYGAKTSAACDQYARTYMAQLCNTFKSSHSYMDIRLK